MTTPFARRVWSKAMTICLCLVLLLNTSLPGKACGPEPLVPIFVFKESPDLPFEDFVSGNIGIVRPGFGRKTFVIAHRYLNGGGFTGDEQRELVDTLKAKTNEDAEDGAIKSWIAARKEVVGDEKAPSIYEQRRYSGYDFFPNCSADAFKVATQTLKDRVSSYGAENVHVRNWLRGQDIVFRNCAEGALAPAPAGPESPLWLQKDRSYQIAAAAFYSLNFNDAEQRFRTIAQDPESAWQETAEYLVGRTLVRAASLATDAKEQVTRYEQAETELINIAGGSGKFSNAAQRLIARIKYKLRPQERVKELGEILDQQSGNDNIRQDLIDYAWLLDKFEAQVQQQEAARQKALNPTPESTPSYQPDPAYVARRAALERGDLIVVSFTPKRSDGEPDYQKSVNLFLKPDITEAEVLQEMEVTLARKLMPEEIASVKESYASAVSERQWKVSPNRKFPLWGEHEGCSYPCVKLKLGLFPEALRADELSDWILTFESEDPAAYEHALRKWRSTHSAAWLVTALTKASASSRSLVNVMRAADRIQPDNPAYASVVYQLVRLRSDLNQPVAARKLLDQVETMKDVLPVSSQNLFREQRMNLASSATEFLKFAPRKPSAFYQHGVIARLPDLMQVEKSFWDATYYTETKDEYEQNVDKEWRELLPWDDRYVFDDKTANVLNWHFSAQNLLEAARNPELPDYLRKSLIPVVWTRAVLLDNERVALSAARTAIEIDPDMGAIFTEYVRANSGKLREREALYILAKYPSMSPYVSDGVPALSRSEDMGYFFESAWWCRPNDVEYKDDGTESPLVVQSPAFLSRELLAEAKQERSKLLDIGDASRWIGVKTLDWAKSSPNDPRIAEVLFIAIKANGSYKYGCNGWEYDEELRDKLEALLRERYPNSPWVAKLSEN
jgi:TolA-binding protein